MSKQFTSFKEYKHKIKIKKEEKFEKRKLERKSTPDEIIFIFEKTLQDWKPIKIFNILIQQNPNSTITQKDVKNIYKGNVKILPSEVDNETYNLYQNLREQVYNKHNPSQNII